ncbi:hypothetical protein SCLCIDRAFT_1115462 [Scleroderma citrinum Foug A]|uniref:Uncharacterized protein n=1 Tax=Scleroderma citrinum Foug A TaxID=1036808 RepID=A0A0C3DP10_9AGAM|nr:hypothetical protein SCLCIDRAFT_1115462 [Scleroderma citrinum Foug A]
MMARLPAHGDSKHQMTYPQVELAGLDNTIVHRYISLITVPHCRPALAHWPDATEVVGSSGTRVGISYFFRKLGCAKDRCRPLRPSCRCTCKGYILESTLTETPGCECDV